MARAFEVYRRFDGAAPESLWDSGTQARDVAAEQSSRELRDATQALFRKWEHDNGFVEGAGQILLPAGRTGLGANPLTAHRKEELALLEKLRAEARKPEWYPHQ